MAKTSSALTDKQLKALEAVQKINNEQHDKKGWNHHHNLLSITIASYYFFITFNINDPVIVEIPIYNSENEDRIFYEKSNKYEEWYSYIKRKLREVKNDINNIKL